MLFRNKKILKFTVRQVLFLYALSFLLQFSLIVQAQCADDNNCASSISLELRLVPTSVVVTAPNNSAVEGSAAIPFTATAYYGYPGLATPIPPKDITLDPLTTWSSSAESVATVTTIGGVTPVSDLNQGSAQAVIRATYGGIEGLKNFTVYSVAALSDGTPVGGSGGGGGNYVPIGNTNDTPVNTDNNSDSNNGDAADEDMANEQNTPDETVESNTEQTINDLKSDESSSEVISTDEPKTTEGSENASSTNSQNGAVNSGVVSSSADNSAADSRGNSGEDFGGDISAGNEVLSPAVLGPEILEFRPFQGEPPVSIDSNFKMPRDVVGRSRGELMLAVSEYLGVKDVRGELIEKAKKDTENALSIFLLNTKFDGVDVKKLKIYPDIPSQEEIDAMKKTNPKKAEIMQNILDLSMIAVVNGYYNTEMEIVADGKIFKIQSPFLPDKPMVKAEFLKLIYTTLALYDPEEFDPSLFYKEVYATKLQAAATPFGNSDAKVSEVLLEGPLFARLGNFWLHRAKALTPSAIDLIKKQRTPFIDIRPDLNDAQWYYPIVFNKACEIGILMPCTSGIPSNADQIPDLNEVKSILEKTRKYMVDKKLIDNAVRDEDTDGISSLDEGRIYATFSDQADSDGDELMDGEELFKYFTDPNIKDSDGDLLSDGEEIHDYQTNPKLVDSDEDLFNDKIEISAGTDPLDIKSTPTDANGNGIQDGWEIKHNLIIVNSSQDTDSDGLADSYEYNEFTDPLKIDTDVDGLTDSEEVLEFLSDPNDALSPGALKGMEVKISNLKNGQVVADASPMIKGIAPASLGEVEVRVQIMVKNEYGHEKLLGEVITDQKGGFIFEPELGLKNGAYLLEARAFKAGQMIVSKPIKITIDTGMVVQAPKLERLEDQKITEEILKKNLVVDVRTVDGRPTLHIKNSEIGSHIVTWKSIVTSSALIADSTSGEYALKAPQLEDGRHVVYIQTVRKKDNAVSETVKLFFHSGTASANFHEASGSDEGGASGFGVLGFFTEEESNTWIFVMFGGALIIGAGYYIYWVRKHRSMSKDQKKVE